MTDTLNIANDNMIAQSAVGSDIMEAKETTQVVVSEDPVSVLFVPMVPANDNHPTLPSDEIALPVVGMGNALTQEELLTLAVQSQNPQNLLDSISNGLVDLSTALNQLGIPSNPDELSKYIMKEGAVVGSFIRLDCKKNQDKLGDAYKKLVQGGQYFAIKLLLAKFFIGQQLLGATAQHGKRDKTQKQAIADLYGLGSRQVRDYQKLVWEKMLEVMTKALETDEIPTVKDCLGTTRHKMKDDWTRTKGSWDPIIATKYKTLELDEPLNVGDICACIGSGTSKLKDINVHCKVALEVDPQRMNWHKLVHPDCESIAGDVMDVEVQKAFIKAFKENNCRVLSFSCPCQTSSPMNSSKNKGKDIRSRIIKSVLDIVDELKPDFILSENVPEWLTNSPECCQDFLQGKTIWQYFEEREKDTYNLNVGVFNAADYNTAENSVRGIVLGVRKEIAPIWEFPKPQEIRTTFMDVCGDLKPLKSGEVDPKVPLHYERGELEAHEIAFIERTPTGCSAWDNSKQYQPTTKANLISGASFGRGFARNEWGKPVGRITSASGTIGDVNSLHPGRPLSEAGKYSDPRVLSVREVMRCIGLDDSFPIPVEVQENGMLSKTDEAFVRECLGEHFCPNHVNALYSTLPVSSSKPQSDNLDDELQKSS